MRVTVADGCNKVREEVTADQDSFSEQATEPLRGKKMPQDHTQSDPNFTE